MASVTGAAQAAASRNHDAAVPQSSSARQLWELSAAASSSSAERADLVSPTVLPQLSQSEKQVRTRCDLAVGVPMFVCVMGAKASVINTGGVPCEVQALHAVDI